MPVFRYHAIDASGRNVNGAMPAHDESNLEEKLKSVGLWLVDAGLEDKTGVTEPTKDSRLRWLTGMGSRKRRNLIDFCTLMSFQIKVGVPLVQALEVAALECEHKPFQSVILGVRRQIESGFLFWEALEKYPTTFSPEFIAVIRAGEQSSRLPDTFNDLKKYLEWVEQIIADVRQASLYPAIVLSVVCAFVLFLFTYIIPKFVVLLEATHAPLPLITTIVFGASDLLRTTWWIWLPGIFVVTLGVVIGRRVSKRFAYFVDSIKLNLPIFGELNRMLSVSRFAHNLAILYRSGIPILQSLHLCQNLVGNTVVEAAVADVEERVKAGDTISEAIRQEPVFPAMLLRMVIMGENTGNLDAALENVSDYYNQVIPRRVKKVITIMEPMLIVLLIFIVGAVALSIFLPILSLMNAIK